MEFIGGLIVILVELRPPKRLLAPMVLQEARRQFYDTDLSYTTARTAGSSRVRVLD